MKSWHSRIRNHLDGVSRTRRRVITREITVGGESGGRDIAARIFSILCDGRPIVFAARSAPRGVQLSSLASRETLPRCVRARVCTPSRTSQRNVQDSSDFAGILPPRARLSSLHSPSNGNNRINLFSPLPPPAFRSGGINFKGISTISEKITVNLTLYVRNATILLKKLLDVTRLIIDVGRVLVTYLI